VGVAIARELSKHKISVIVVDRKDDVGGDASKACSACISTENSVTPDTLESTISVASKTMAAELCRELDIPISDCGNLTVAITEAEEEKLPAMLQRAFDNRVYDVEYRTREEILTMEPHINREVRAGLFDPRTSQVNVFEFVIAQAENAATNGVKFLFDCRVVGVAKENGRIRKVETDRGEIATDWLINCAGLHCDTIAEMTGDCDFTVHPRKGQFILLDKDTAVKVRHIVSTPPTSISRGKLICPTVDGNILNCTTAEDLLDKTDKKTTAEGFRELIAESKKMIPDIRIEDTILQFSGLSPAREPEGYHIEISKKVKGFVSISGIRSSGVTGSLGIAKYTLQMMRNAGLKLERKSDYIAARTGIKRFAEASAAEKDKLISTDRRYGNIVCRCEMITEMEILQAIRRHPGACTVDAIKRRVRAGAGRCQGGFCGSKVMEILERELKMESGSIRKRDNNSYMLAEGGRVID
jgi:glycerol-3-phosphate dehydrogenase